MFTLVVLLVLGVRTLGTRLTDDSSALIKYGGHLPGSFLDVIAILNTIALVGIVKVLLEMRRAQHDDAELEKHLNSRGFMMRFFGPSARSIDRPWKLYPLGLLVGLCLDTATEIAFLILADTSIAAGCCSGRS